MKEIINGLVSFALRNKRSIFIYLILLLVSLYVVLPLLILGFNSFKTNMEIAVNPFGPPKNLQWSNYTKAWIQGRFGTAFRNSFVLVAISVIGVAFVAFPAGYALARYTPRGYDFFISYLILGSTIPNQLFIVPLFIAWSRLNLMDNLFGLSLIYIAKFTPFATFLVRAFLLSISKEFDDAARVDGASELQVLTKILIPMSWPIVLTVSLITAVRVWNEFFFAVTFIQNEALKPVATSLFAFQGKYNTNWGLTNAASVLTVLPVLFLFLLLQRHFIEGLTQGGLKS